MAWALPPTPISAEVKERGELYLSLPVWAFVTGYKGEFHVSSFFLL
jgi:hypothetical protein